MAEFEDYAEITTLEDDDLVLIRKNDGAGGWTGARRMTGLQMKELFGFTKKVTIASADVLDLNVTQQELLPAPAAGYFYLITGVYARLTGGTPTAYGGTFDDLGVYFASGTNNIYEFTDFLSIADNFGVGEPLAKATGQNVFTAEALNIFVPSGNPTGGDQDLEVYVSYKLIEA